MGSGRTSDTLQPIADRETGGTTVSEAEIRRRAVLTRLDRLEDEIFAAAVRTCGSPQGGNGSSRRLLGFRGKFRPKFRHASRRVRTIELLARIEYDIPG